ncbi:hypothetical protein NEAUS05_0292 [Nematocida ausubeli]|nr:hypothetical protein NEAUS07_0646 [Nematocida ausubeli]KAI5134691.1 hypothetical protein NEAUS06_1250 [Nematocida ausubeli]KAI5146956.1 hypothetical protein NEAUS05_0292 [Nematocida ausubeli]
MHAKYMDKRAFFSVLVELMGTLLGLAFLKGPLLYLFSGLTVTTSLLIIIIGRMDPGVLSRRNSNYHKHVFFSGFAYRTVEDDKNILGRGFERKGQTLHTEVFCKTCGIFRPSGASHCRECDRCISVMDHHCHWLSNCIGEKNYPYFMNLLSLEFIRGVVLVYFRFSQDFPELKMSYSSAYFYITLVWSSVLAAFISSLFGYFMWLNLQGYTSRGFCKQKQVRAKD